MKYLATFLFALAFVWVGHAHAASPKKITEIIKGPITVKATTSPLLDVQFNHSSHKGIKCANCHHRKPKGVAFDSCSAANCHIFKGAHNPSTLSTFTAFHATDTDRSCVGCHTKLATSEPAKHPTFKGCMPCHTSTPPAGK